MPALDELPGLRLRHRFKYACLLPTYLYTVSIIGSLTSVFLSRYRGEKDIFQTKSKVWQITSANLLAAIDRECDVERNNELAVYIKSLRPRSAFRGVVWLRFGDVRDKYLNSRDTLLRFGCVQDMVFDANDDAIMNIDVSMQDDRDADTIEVKPKRISYGYHRISTLPAAMKERDINTQLQPMTWAILQRRHADQENRKIYVVRVLERSINGRSYGDCNAAERIHIRLWEQADMGRGVFVGLTDDHKSPEYADLLDEELEKALSENLKEDQRKLFSFCDTPSPIIPKLPDMTFQQYPLKSSESDMPKGETFLAATMVN